MFVSRSLETKQKWKTSGRHLDSGVSECSLVLSGSSGGVLMNASFSGFLDDVFFLINLTSLALAAMSDAPNDENSEACDTARALLMGKISLSRFITFILLFPEGSTFFLFLV